MLLEKEVDEGRISLIPKCKGTKLSHLIFADDLLIFSRADNISLTTINKVLSTFASYSGLYVNKEKSTQIFAGLTTNEANQLQRITEL